MALRKKNSAGMAALAVIAAAALSGCSLTPQQAEQPTTEAAVTPVVISPETEEQTETAQTETQTEKKELSLSDIQVSVGRIGRTGTVSLQIDDTLGSTAVSQAFTSSSSAFQAVADDGMTGVYAGDDGILYQKDGAWKEIGGKCQGLFSLIYDEGCEKLEPTAIDGTACYHLSVESEDSVSFLLAYCYANGYTDIVGGSTQADFYVSEETNEIVRADVSMAFMATAADGTDVKGEIYGSIFVSGSSDAQLSAPEAVVETEAVVDTYTPGEIVADRNGYLNQTYGIQIIGGNLFTFDADKTQELKDSYTASGSAYTEEAYGGGDSVLLNISSVLSNGRSTEDVLSNYLSDSAAENIAAGDNVDFAGKTYATMTSTINQTQTKTYGTGVDGRVLIFTLYYTDETSVSQFEANIYTTSDNPYWEAASWTLESKYQVTTPYGYSIVSSESSDLYVCMSSSTDTVNVFAMEGSTIDAEAEKETVSEGDTSREIRAQEEIALADGSTMRYYAVYNTEPNLSYYTYVGLIQKDTAVIKFYSVSTADTADYKNVYSELANGTTVIGTATDGAGETIVEETVAAETQLVPETAAETAAQS